MGRSFFARHWRHAALVIAFSLTGLGIFAAPLRSALGPAMPFADLIAATTETARQHLINGAA